MTDKLRLGTQVQQIKLGASFTGDKSSGFHTLRYDFKPASVDPNKIATVDVGASNQISVTVPHLDGAGTQQTVFKGSYRPYQKECVLIIDNVTGEITLEKLSNNIQLKKTRTAPQKAGDPSSKNVWKNTDAKSMNPGLGSSSKSKTNSVLVPRHSPLHASPHSSPFPAHHKSPNRSNPQQKSPPQLALNNRSASPSFSNHMPVLGVEETSTTSMTGYKNRQEPSHSGNMECPVGVLSSSGSDSESNSDSSSDSSDSESSSVSDSPSSPQSHRPNGHVNAKSISSSTSKQILSQDLQLSESDSDF